AKTDVRRARIAGRQAGLLRVGQVAPLERDAGAAVPGQDLPAAGRGRGHGGAACGLARAAGEGAARVPVGDRVDGDDVGARVEQEVLCRELAPPARRVVVREVHLRAGLDA